MKRSKWFVLAIAISAIACVNAAEKPDVHEPAVAGMFYPADPQALSAFVDGAMSRARVEPIDAQLVALIAPHAGYPYSGEVAAHSYAALKGKKYSRVIVIAPSHYAGFEYSAVYDGSAYATPLGKIEVDTEFAKRLAKEGKSIHLSRAGHDPGNGRGEHSLEVQLPFLQRALGEFRLVPIIMGNPSYETSRDLAIALAKLLRDDSSTLLVASSDLSHFHTYDAAARMDGDLLAAVANDDFYSVSTNVSRGHWEACGIGPILTVMMAASRMGASDAKLLKYANSGDSTGDKSRVVGYGAVAFVRSRNSKPEDYTLGETERAELLRIARTSVETVVRTHKAYEVPVPAAAKLLAERGAFVTITKHGALRGCIGYTTPVLPLYETVRDVAAFAATRDPRFPAVTESELNELEYEVSVLSPLHYLNEPKLVRIGEDGLLLHRGRDGGLLLPQVPVEQKWNAKTFLEETSLKAGLDSNAWQDPETDMFAFTAVVFSDRKAPQAEQPAQR